MTVIKEARICIVSVVLFSSLTIWTMFFVAAKAETTTAIKNITAKTEDYKEVSFSKYNSTTNDRLIYKSLGLKSKK